VNTTEQVTLTCISLGSLHCRVTYSICRAKYLQLPQFIPTSSDAKTTCIGVSFICHLAYGSYPPAFIFVFISSTHDFNRKHPSIDSGGSNPYSSPGQLSYRRLITQNSLKALVLSALPARLWGTLEVPETLVRLHLTLPARLRPGPPTISKYSFRRPLLHPHLHLHFATTQLLSAQNH
jgi:hypothetical protein